MKAYIIEIDAHAAFLKLGVDLKTSPLAAQSIDALRTHLIKCITPEMIVAAQADAARTGKPCRGRKQTGAAGETKPEGFIDQPDRKKAEKKPKLRNHADQKRKNKFIIRVSEGEMRKIRAMFGRNAAAIARILLLGHDVPKPTALESAERRELMRALHCHFMAMQPIRNHFIRRRGENDKAILDNEIEKFNNLVRICF